MSAKGPHHIHLEAHGHYDATLTFDGDKFPYDIYSVRYELAATEAPKVILEFRPEHLTIEHTPPAIDFDQNAWDDRIAEAFQSAEDGKAHVIDGRHADSTIRIVVFPDPKEATA